MSRPLKGKAIEAFGGAAVVEVDSAAGTAPILTAQEVIQEVHNGLSRFDPESELSRLNRDPNERVPASPLMLRFITEAKAAAEMTGGLVDPTVLSLVEAAGYRTSFADGVPEGGIQSSDAPAGWQPGQWASIQIDPERGEVIREPGIRLDAGGIGKGLAADLVAEALQADSVPFFTVNCLGDLRIGGTLGEPREVLINSPLGDREPIAQIKVTDGSIATSGTTKRSWSDQDERLLHHLIDPTTGRPAETGLVQVSAVAPTATEAEARAKAALLSGPERASDWLPNGGVVVSEDGSFEVVGEPVGASI